MLWLCAAVCGVAHCCILLAVFFKECFDDEYGSRFFRARAWIFVVLVSSGLVKRCSGGTVGCGSSSNLCIPHRTQWCLVTKRLVFNMVIRLPCIDVNTIENTDHENLL